MAAPENLLPAPFTPGKYYTAAIKHEYFYQFMNMIKYFNIYISYCQMKHKMVINTFNRQGFGLRFDLVC